MKRAFLLMVSLVALGVAVQAATASAQGHSALERNKALGERFHLEVIQGQKLDLVEELFAADAAIHNGRREFVGPEGAKQIAVGDAQAFPGGMTFVHANSMAEGNLVAFRWTMTAVSADGDTSVFEGLDLLRIENGKIAELWIEYHSVGGR